MKAPTFTGPLHTVDSSMLQTAVVKVVGQTSHEKSDTLAIEEPLEIQLTYGPSNSRQTRSISVTMRTPGNDFDLAAGFLMTEGVIQGSNDIEKIAFAGHPLSQSEQSSLTMEALKLSSKENTGWAT